MRFEFSPHGEFSLIRCDKTVISRLTGAWNKEAAEKYEREFMQVASPLSGQKWAHLVYLEDWELGVPDIAAPVMRLVDWCIDNGLCRTAQVYSESMTKQYLVDKLVVDEKGDFRRRVFQEEKRALRWLAQQGYPMICEDPVKAVLDPHSSIFSN